MLPERIVVEVELNGSKTAGLFVVVQLKSRRKNDYSLVMGPTDASGLLVLSRADLLREGALEKSLFPSDYGDVEADFAGEIAVEPLDLDGIRRARDAHELFHEVSSFPQDYSDDLRRAEALFEKGPAVARVVSVRQEGGDARLTLGRIRRE